MGDTREIISVIGLGYVGLPVGIAFSKRFKTIGFDIDVRRIEELKMKVDRTGEVTLDDLQNSKIKFTCEPRDISEATFHIVTVPTPIDSAYRPDLTALRRASETVGKFLKRGDVVVYESTVYPGLTEEECVPLLEKHSGLKCGPDFKIGYSPERINPGDQEHRFETIRKVVSGQDEEALNRIALVYEKVVTAGVFRASSIKVAEAAKIIENTQRDLNVALTNELSIIFDRMGISTQDVLDAANTKWNFLDFKPGLVGGHCIGVDPYYLTHKAQMLGYIPQVILAGRRVNNDMGKVVAQRTIKQLALAGIPISNSTVTILGVTFKENCPDIRNSRVIDIVSELQSYGIKLQVSDPFASRIEIWEQSGIDLIPFEELKPADAVIVAVSHKTYANLSNAALDQLMKNKRILIDVKALFSKSRMADAGVTHSCL